MRSSLMGHRSLVLAQKRATVEPSYGRYLILSPTGMIVHYHGEGHGDRLGPLAKRILTMLFQEPLTEAELARRLGLRHQTVYKALWRLARKELVESRILLGRNLAGAKIRLRFYSLDPEKVSKATPVPRPTTKKLAQAGSIAQAMGLVREREGMMQQLALSFKLRPRSKTLLCLYGKE